MTSSGQWPTLNYADWAETCDTLHAHTQVLGKLAATLAPPEPQFLHAALRLTARGWETHPLPAPDGSGAFVVALDLRTHEAVVEHSDSRTSSLPLTPDRAVGAVTSDLLEAVSSLAGPVAIDPKPEEVEWTVPLDEDTEHARYDADHVATYFAIAARVALALAAFRAPYRGRSTQLNAWWGSFDLAVSLYSGNPNSMDSREVAVGWWPGDHRYGNAAFYAYAHPAPKDLAADELGVPGARWDNDLGEFFLDWDDVAAGDDPHATALAFARSVFRRACRVYEWDPELAASAESSPPPVT